MISETLLSELQVQVGETRTNQSSKSNMAESYQSKKSTLWPLFSIKKTKKTGVGWAPTLPQKYLFRIFLWVCSSFICSACFISNCGVLSPVSHCTLGAPMAAGPTQSGVKTTHLHLIPYSGCFGEPLGAGERAHRSELSHQLASAPRERC